MSVSDLQKRAARAGWALTATRNGFMLRKGNYSKHFGELCDVQRDVARMAVPRRPTMANLARDKSGYGFGTHF